MQELDKFGGRKFIVCMYSITVSTLLVAFGLIPATAFQAIMLGVPLYYVSANVIQKQVTKPENN